MSALSLLLSLTLVAGAARDGPAAWDCYPDRRLPVGFQHGNLTAAKTLTSGSTFAIYLGRACARYSSVVVRWRVTTAAATVTWAEVAIATGSGAMAGASTLTTRGYTDVAAVITSTGQKSTTVAVSGIEVGDDVWVLIGNAATTAGIVRAGLADDLQVGFNVSAAARPSTMAAATSFAVEGATAAALWVAIEPT